MRFDVAHRTGFTADNHGMRNGSLPGELDAAQERAAGNTRGRKEDVISLHQSIGIKDLGKVDARFLNSGFFRFGLGIEAGKHGATRTFDGAGRQYAFRRAAGSHHDIDLGTLIHGHQGTGDVAVGMQLDACAYGPDFLNKLLVAGLIENEDDKVVGILAQRFGDEAEVDMDRRIQIDDVTGGLADNQLLHVEAGAGVVHAASRSGPDDGNGVGTPISEQVGSLDGIHGDVKGRPIAHADDFAVVEHGRFVLFAFSDDDFARNGQGIEGQAHGVHGGAVSGVFVAASEPARGRKGGGFGDTDKIKGKVALRRFHKGHIALQKYEWFMNARPSPIRWLRRYSEHRSGEAALQGKARHAMVGRHTFREGGFMLERDMSNHTKEVLPIEALLPDLLEALGGGTRCILEAAPGAGKTTRVPLALLRAAWLGGKGILMLEPRRMAARNAARYMASLLGEKVGQTIGYRVRLDSRVSAATRITVVTEGVLTRMLQEDPELQGVGCLIFDEFHERSLNADLGLALALDCQQGLRDDLRLLIMSATLDSGPLLKLLQQDFPGEVPVLRSRGRTWPVETYYFPLPRTDMPMEAWVADAVRRALREEDGSILVFLPGVGEIRKVEALLQGVRSDTVHLCPLYGDLPAAEQDAAIASVQAPLRKIVLATSIAETSLTIEGVRVVIDSGLARTVRFDAGMGMSRLVTERVSLASAEQRRGRAGRTGPGVCYRLWHQGDEAGMAAHTRPEILDADMAPLCLELAVWGIAAPSSLHWLDEPPAEAVNQALPLLRSLEAVDAAWRVTARGKAMARLPLHPRLAHMVLAAKPLGLGKAACLLAAMADERDPLRLRDADIRPRLALLEHGQGTPAVFRIREAARQIGRLVDAAGELPYRNPVNIPEEEQAGVLLALAYPDRLAQKRSRGSYRMVNGRGGFLDDTDSLADEPVLAVGAVNGGSGNVRIWQAAPLSQETVEALYHAQFTETEEVVWDSREQAVAARRRVSFGAFILEETPLRSGGGSSLADRVAQAVLSGIRELGLACLPWTDELQQWRLRVELLRAVDKGGDWPDVSEEPLLAGLEDWLIPFLQGISRRSQFSKIDLAAALHALLPWRKQRELDVMAPTHMEVPSGSFIRLHYEASAEGIVPVLAVKLQEMFGMQGSPAVAEGKVPVLVHLLSPAGRPLQITRDLKGFWKNGYPAVRAEMRGRYPKHPWPEDPFAALPTRLTNRRLQNRS